MRRPLTARTLPTIVVGMALALFVAALLALAGTAAAVSSGRQSRIVGGSQASARNWPFLAALLTPGTKSPFERQFCGASVVAPGWVLTAAHCVTNDAGVPVDPSTVNVLTGTISLDPGLGVESPVTQVAVFPGYPKANDAALLRLAVPTDATPVPVMRPDQTSLLVPGTRASVAGWGDTGEDAGVFPVIARQVPMPLISVRDCNTALGGGVNAASEICAGGSASRTDSCQGDSGGPLVVATAGTPVLVGIVSWGQGCARAYTPGVYARAAAVFDWATQTMDGVPPTTITVPPPTLRTRAQRAVGRRGAAIDLAYRVSGPSPTSSEYVAVLDDRGRIVHSIETAVGPMSSQYIYSVRWRVPARQTRPLYFCVASAAPNQDYGEPSCARIVIRAR